jgi:hypothetical protein
MKHRTAKKTGRTAAMQLHALQQGAFSDYVAMADRTSAGDVRPLPVRLAAPRRMP